MTNFIIWIIFGALACWVASSQSSGILNNRGETLERLDYTEVGVFPKA